MHHGEGGREGDGPTQRGTMGNNDSGGGGRTERTNRERERERERKGESEGGSFEPFPFGDDEVQRRRRRRRRRRGTMCENEFAHLPLPSSLPLFRLNGEQLNGAGDCVADRGQRGKICSTFHGKTEGGAQAGQQQRF